MAFQIFVPARSSNNLVQQLAGPYSPSGQFDEQVNPFIKKIIRAGQPEMPKDPGIVAFKQQSPLIDYIATWYASLI